MDNENVEIRNTIGQYERNLAVKLGRLALSMGITLEISSKTYQEDEYTSSKMVLDVGNVWLINVDSKDLSAFWRKVKELGLLEA